MIEPESYDTGYMAGWDDRRREDVLIVYTVMNEINKDSNIFTVFEKIIKRMKELK